MAQLHGKICLVTGASRGVGKGVALGLAQAGATVYVTARSGQATHNGQLPGSLQQTVNEIDALGGKGVGVVCDMGDDAQIVALCQRIQQDHGGLDILVNCAIALPDDIVSPKPFWEKSFSQVDVLTVGLRSNYVMAYHAAALLIKNKGLMVSISSPGSRCYMHGPAYGAGKAGTDKMTHDMAHDFKPYGVTAVGLWPGVVRTERLQALQKADPNLYQSVAGISESQILQGQVLASLYADAQHHGETGKGFYTADLANRYGLVDDDGKAPTSPAGMFGPTTEFSAVVIN
jgi:NAD(P)-dependent dehydrogenase (short-subunit alcohol dehydrogenase family)